MILASILGLLGTLWAVLKLFGYRLAAFFKGRAGRFVLIFALVLGALMAWFSKNRSTKENDTADRRLVILAFGGLDPQLLEQYMAGGRLPHFSELAEKGIYHSLATTNPPQSPVAWASFITGDLPESHGIYDFLKRDPKTYLPDLTISDRQNLARPWRGEPFWQSAELKDVSKTLVRLPLAFPPPKLKGRVLAGMGVWDARGTEGTYFYFTTGPLPEDIRGMAFQFEREGETLTGSLPGPYRAGQDDNVREPFEVRADGAAFELHIQGQSYSLQPDSWSPWITIDFKLGLAQRIKTITKVWLARDAGNISLYVSPLNLHPSHSPYAISYPRNYADEFVKETGLFHTRGMPFDTHALNDGVLTDKAFLDQWDAITSERERMLEYELKRLNAGLLFVYFESSDLIQHMYFRGIDPLHPLYEESAGLRNVIPEAYERCDLALGRTMQSLNEQDGLIVISDHGFAPFRHAVQLNAILRDEGYLILKDGNTNSPEFFKHADWSKTRAYAYGFNAIYLNIEGREAEGSLPTDQVAELKADIKRKLEEFKDPKTGEHPIKSVYSVEKDDTEEWNAVAPDLIVGYRRGYRGSWETALGKVIENAISPNKKKWSGDHCMDPSEVPGIFLSNIKRLDCHHLREVGNLASKFFDASHRP